MNEQSKIEKAARIIKADLMLRAKIGTGSLDPAVIMRCQNVMEKNDIDFSPIAKEYLNQLSEALEQVKNNIVSGRSAIQALTEPVMQLKANAKIFHYELIGNLANIMLNFLEHIKELDSTALEIVEAHHKTLSIIISQKMTGKGSVLGKKLEDELKNACKRYAQKQKS